MSNKEKLNIFYDFGRYMRILGAATILCIFPYVSFVGMVMTFIVIILVSVDLRNININLKNPHLNEFRIKFLKGVIIRVIGMFISTISISVITFLIFARIVSGRFYFPRGVIITISWGIVTFIGYILVIVGSSKEMGAWKKFIYFVQYDENLISHDLSVNIMDGADKCHTGALLFTLGFLVITIFIGFIFQVVGYFKLSSLRKSKKVYPETQREVVRIQPQPIKQSKSIPIPNTKDEIKFCPHCGEKIRPGARFCAICGSSLKDI